MNLELESRVRELTVIVCCYNEVKNIKKCLESIIKQNPAKTLVVDANSNDGTRDIIKKLGIKILDDPKKGLAIARNIGLSEANTKYVIYVGPDNIMPPNSFSLMIEELKVNNWIGNSCQTITKNNTKSHLINALNIYRKSRYFPGERDIIGTPWLYYTSVLKKYKFDDNMPYSDDTELCYRLKEDNYKIGIGNTICYEIGRNTISSIKEKWMMYGKSDCDFYMKIKGTLNISSKIKSRFNSIRVDFLIPLKSKYLSISEKIYLLPFLVMINYFRIRGFQKRMKGCYN